MAMPPRGPPLLQTGNDDVSGRPHLTRVRVAEVAGGTAAECTAVCCCVPCVVVELLVHAVYKVPAVLCRKALRRRLTAKKGLFPPAAADDSIMRIHHLSPTAVEALDEDVIELEKEMWNKFYSGGFWRSFSQRSDVSRKSNCT